MNSVTMKISVSTFMVMLWQSNPPNVTYHHPGMETLLSKPWHKR